MPNRSAKYSACPSQLCLDPAVLSCPDRNLRQPESFRLAAELPKDTSDHTSGLMVQKVECFADFWDRSWDRTARLDFERITAARMDRRPNSIWCTADDVEPMSLSQDRRC